MSLGLAGTFFGHSMLLASLLLRVGGPWAAQTMERKGSDAHIGEVLAELSDPIILMPSINRPGPERAQIGQSRRPEFAVKMLAVRVAMPSELPHAEIEAAGAALQAPATLEADSDLLQTCRREYANGSALSRDIATVSLQGFVIREGQIRQGRIEISGGDRARARIALQCLQLLGTLGPTQISLSSFDPPPR